jgi:hypothetical protein
LSSGGTPCPQGVMSALRRTRSTPMRGNTFEIAQVVQGSAARHESLEFLLQTVDRIDAVMVVRTADIVERFIADLDALTQYTW